MTSSDADLAKLRWRCRRGMRELDALLVGWLDMHYANADDKARQGFAKVVAMQDPDIMALINKSSSESENPGANAGNHPDGNSTDKQHNISISSKDSSFEKLIEQIRSFLPT